MSNVLQKKATLKEYLKKAEIERKRNKDFKDINQNLISSQRKSKERQLKINNTTRYFPLITESVLENKLDKLVKSENFYEEEVKNYLMEFKKQDPKKHIFVNKKILSDIDSLYEEFPNFSEVVDFIKKRIKFEYFKKQPISLPPINLDGEPGIGKTYFSKRLSEILDTDRLKINVSQLVSGHELFGLSNKWGHPAKGILFQRLAEDTNFAQPVVLLDELCKTSVKSTNGPSIQDSLLVLLERETANSVTDSFLDIDFDASKAIYISTTNEFESLCEPLQSRLLNFKVKKPNHEELTMIVNNMYKNLLQEYQEEEGFEEKLSEEIIESFKDMDLREVKSIIEKTIITAFLNNKEQHKRDKVIINKKDIEEEKNITQLKNRRKIGF